MSQMKGAECAMLSFGKSGHQSVSAVTSALIKVSQYVDDVALAASNASGVKNVAAEVVENGASKVVKYSAAGVGASIGISAAIELVCSAYKVYKYKTDYKYLKCDLWRDLGRSWIVTGVCTALGVSLIPIGWWAILPAAAMGFV